MWLPWPKATLLVTSGPAHDPERKHLFILLTHGLGEEDEVLMVSLQSIVDQLQQDDSCVVEPGEHLFVRHGSFVRYDKCRKVAANKLVQAVGNGTMIPHDQVSDALFERICSGLKLSTHTPPWAKTLLMWHENLK